MNSNNFIDVSLNHSKKKTFDQQKLIFGLYNIMANEQNAGKIDKGNVKAIDLYINDLWEHKPIEKEIDTIFLSSIESEFRILEKRKSKDPDKTIVIVAYSMRLWDIEYASKWIEMLFNRLAEIGVSESSDIDKYWHDWKINMNNEKFILNSGITDKEEYKKLNSSCEACAKYVGEGGDLAHIRAIGRGGNPEPEKEISDNWLILCRHCHTEQHQLGWNKFIVKHRHLKFKVEIALSKDLTDTESKIIETFGGVVQ
jgi:hypothetical protein